MTRERELVHRPGCPEPGTRASVVGSWWVIRCNGCNATSTKRRETPK